MEAAGKETKSCSYELYDDDFQITPRDDQGKVQCVAQFPAGTSFRPKKSKLGYFRWDFNSSSTEAIRQKNKHLRYQLIILVGLLVDKRANKKGFCSDK